VPAGSAQFSLVVRSVQTPLQHSDPIEQKWEHLPQLLMSVVRFAQYVPQATAGAVQLRTARLLDFVRRLDLTANLCRSQGKHKGKETTREPRSTAQYCPACGTP